MEMEEKKNEIGAEKETEGQKERCKMTKVQQTKKESERYKPCMRETGSRGGKRL